MQTKSIEKFRGTSMQNFGAFPKTNDFEKQLWRDNLTTHSTNIVD